MSTTEESVIVFLRSFKETMTCGRGLDFVPREENNQTAIELGLTRKTIETEILELSVSDYCAGPEKDHSRPGMIWKFGKKIKDYDVYIKLKLAEHGDVKIAKCISFHKANHPINYPLRN